MSNRESDGEQDSTRVTHPLLEDLKTADDAEAREIVWQMEYALELCGIDHHGDPVGAFKKLVERSDYDAE